MVSHYKQATLLDCGMACVKTIISYYFPKLEHLDSLEYLVLYRELVFVKLEKSCQELTGFYIT